MAGSFDAAWWSVQLPSGWNGRVDEQCVTFCGSPNLGALQISSARKESGPVTDQDLREFAEEHIAENQLKREQYGPFIGFSTEYSKAGFFWRKWWLRSGSLMAFATYNVTQDDKGVENVDVERILDSLRPIL